MPATPTHAMTTSPEKYGKMATAVRRVLCRQPFHPLRRRLVALGAHLVVSHARRGHRLAAASLRKAAPAGVRNRLAALLGSHHLLFFGNRLLRLDSSPVR